MKNTFSGIVGVFYPSNREGCKMYLYTLRLNVSSIKFALCCEFHEDEDTIRNLVDGLRSGKAVHELGFIVFGVPWITSFSKPIGNTRADRKNKA